MIEQDTFPRTIQVVPVVPSRKAGLMKIGLINKMDYSLIIASLSPEQVQEIQAQVLQELIDYIVDEVPDLIEPEDFQPQKG